MVAKILAIPIILYVMSIGIKYLFFTGQIYRRFEKKGDKFGFKIGKFEYSRNYTYFELRFIGILLIIICLIGTYGLFIAHSIKDTK